MPHHPVDFFGTSGNDVFAGENNIDTFHMEDGGDDIVLGKKGADVFLYGASLTAADQISGGRAHDTLFLDGDYASGGGVHFAAATLSGMEAIQLAAGHSYSFFFVDANVDPGALMKIDGTALGTSDSVSVHGGDETDGAYRLIGGAGTAFLQGGAGDDVASGHGFLTCDLSAGGNDRVNAGPGGSEVDFGAALTAGDFVSGGGGHDTVTLDGDYSAGVTLAPTTLQDIDTLRLSDGFSYRLRMDDANLSAGKRMTVDASGLSAGAVFFDAHAESDGSFSFNGGAADATFIGSAKADDITLGTGSNSTNGGGGADLFHPATAGSDTFAYVAVSDSTGLAHDKFDAFSFADFHFDMGESVSGVDAAITGHKLHQPDEATFNNDLATFVDAAHLGAHHAVEIVGHGGALDGHVFVVVDANGIAGYQANQDYVIDLGTNIVGGGTLTVANFV